MIQVNHPSPVSRFSLESPLSLRLGGLMYDPGPVLPMSERNSSTAMGGRYCESSPFCSTADKAPRNADTPFPATCILAGLFAGRCGAEWGVHSRYLTHSMPAFSGMQGKTSNLTIRERDANDQLGLVRIVIH